jgi:hypothetical protein
MELEDLTGCRFIGGPGKDAAQGGAAVGGYKVVGRGQQRIAGEDGFRHAMECVRGRLAPARGCVVDDVIMHERGGVQHFKRAGQGVDLPVPAAEELGRQYGQERAQTFAPGGNGMPCCGTDGSRQLLDKCVESAVYLWQFQSEAGFQKKIGHNLSVTVPPPVETEGSCFSENGSADPGELQRLIFSPQAWISV